MTTKTSIVDISDQSKEILAEIFKNDPAKTAFIDKAVKFVLTIFDKSKIEEYTNEINKIIIIEKGNESEVVEVIEILVSIKNILEDLYSHLETIKETVLTKDDRQFVKNHIDIIAQVIIIVAIDEIEEKNLIDRETLLKILSFVKVATMIDINMNVKKNFCIIL